ncbi:GH36-type glycosyl hydrolase domain-containing protein [Cellvibrio sp. PSBB023]|uniref:GH36-type glycosyl hydrolase domain-containing protein n=1 Tax=Cellvibrio sp. PSBB023 TaxID=1945512 RepID=UPI00098FCBF3|nr:NdvB protein [Cellvibrio sp. PSBB023]AQT60571.1 NdvB protein [Cellvibrio sp. PSBB023]
MSKPLLQPAQQGQRYELYSPTALPRAAGFLWNQRMMIQVTCRGYAVAQFMQPEPAKYAYAPNLEAKTFMQPEQPYYAHHPGRFFYIKDEDTSEIFSAPYEPVRAPYENFVFSVGKSDLCWTITALGIEVHIKLSLPVEDVVELWEVNVVNRSGRARRISVYPYFPVGYMSWMNQSAEYRPDLGGIVASCVTPYQKVTDYFKHKNFKDKTFFLHDQIPTAWEAKQETFEGEGGLHNPSALQEELLRGGDARYETPAAVLQYRLALAADAQQQYRFIFGPAFDDAEITQLRAKYLSADGFVQAQAGYANYIREGSGCLQIETPDAELDNFVNHWLPRQVFYHGDVNRLTTDPQTRNYLQDNMGMTFIKPQVTRAAFLHALSQQEASGAMPDGILLSQEAELKYINQIPHTDHCVWLPVCLKVYLDETNDYAILQEIVAGHDGKNLSVFERISNAMRWLLQARDYRGLSFIAQGDWCDPMNMVGYKGKGVSGWLSVATAYALNLWADVCAKLEQHECRQEFIAGAQAINSAVNKYLWDSNWFGRGITDDDVVFGISKDEEGRIFLNPQSWAILGGAANAEQRQKMIAAVEQQLETPYGVAMLAPAYTAMRDDVGRVTQKHPGSAENGSVYNHAAIFYVFSLFGVGEQDRAYKLLRQMIPGPSEADYVQRGQLPVYIPNYYRGAYHQYPRTAGRSSQLFNTGTVSWVYRCLVEGVFGLHGCDEGLRVAPQLPSSWSGAKATRQFRGATFHLSITRGATDTLVLSCNGERLSGNCVTVIEAGAEYQLEVMIPQA